MVIYLRERLYNNEAIERECLSRSLRTLWNNFLQLIAACQYIDGTDSRSICDHFCALQIKYSPK